MLPAVSLFGQPCQRATKDVSTAGDVLQPHLSTRYERVVLSPKRHLPQLLCAPEVNQTRLAFDTASAVRPQEIRRVVDANDHMTVWSVQGCRDRSHGFYHCAPDPAVNNAIRLVMTFVQN